MPIFFGKIFDIIDFVLENALLIWRSTKQMEEMPKSGFKKLNKDSFALMFGDRMYIPEFGLEVSGDFACFTRPEMKGERFTYDVITPSAARAVFDAILWKPAIQWQITRIEVMNPIKFMNIKRNEINHAISPINAKSMMKGTGKSIIVDSSLSKNRMQRHSVILKDVRYRIYARIVMTKKMGERDDLKKFTALFYKRLRNGRCFKQPYLGCREFSAHFSEITDRTEKPLDITEDLGFMVMDMNYGAGKKDLPLYFHAQMENGVIKVPARVIPDAIPYEELPEFQETPNEELSQ